MSAKSHTQRVLTPHSGAKVLKGAVRASPAELPLMSRDNSVDFRRTMKLLLLIPSLAPGGAERQMVNLARALVDRNVEVHLATFYAGGRLESEVSSVEGVQLHSLKRTGRWDVVRPGWRLRRFIARHPFDVIYSFLPSPNILSLLGKTVRSRPKIVWGIRASRLDYSVYPWTTALAARVERLLSPLANHMIVNSRAGLALWQSRGTPRTRLTYIANGIDAQRYTPDPVARGDAGKELGLSDSSTLVGVVARIDPKKDYKTFMDAAHRLHKQVPEAHFLCIGGVASGMESYAEELRRHVNDLNLTGVVHWLGDRSDVPRWLAALDVLTSPSRFGEGFPNVIAEGMACGVPCVVTDVGDSAEIVGTIGSVVPPGDPAALAEAWAQMLALSKEERTALGERSRSRVEQLFSVDRMADETLRVLRSITGVAQSRERRVF